MFMHLVLFLMIDVTPVPTLEKLNLTYELLELQGE